MNAKVLKIGIVVAVVMYAVEYLLNMVVFNSLYMMNQKAGIPWHNPTSHGIAVLIVTTVIGSIAYAYIFLRGYEGKGMAEGLRFGVWAWLMISVPEVFGYAASLNFGRRLTLAQTGTDLVALVLAGVAAAAVAGAEAGTAKAAAAAK